MSYFKEENINLLFNNQSIEKIDVIQEVINDLSLRIDLVIDPSLIITAVQTREELSTTGFGQGIAIPHAQIIGLKEPIIAIYRFQKQVKWLSMDEQLVEQCFLLLVPKIKGDQTHLKILSKLARMMIDDQFIKKIKAINQTDQLIKYLNKKIN